MRGEVRRHPAECAAALRPGPDRRPARRGPDHNGRAGAARVPRAGQPHDERPHRAVRLEGPDDRACGNSCWRPARRAGPGGPRPCAGDLSPGPGYQGQGPGSDAGRMRRPGGLRAGAARPDPARCPALPQSSRPAGQAFEEIGCADCHRPSLGNIEGIYSDLLLHDMGPDLSQRRPSRPYYGPSGEGR